MKDVVKRIHSEQTHTVSLQVNKHAIATAADIKSKKDKFKHCGMKNAGHEIASLEKCII
jgi:hypothetical protein